MPILLTGLLGTTPTCLGFTVLAYVPIISAVTPPSPPRGYLEGIYVPRKKRKKLKVSIKKEEEIEDKAGDNLVKKQEEEMATVIMLMLTLWDN